MLPLPRAAMLAPLLAVALAGCLTSSAPVAPAGADPADLLSKPLHDLGAMVKEPLEALAPDGKRLDTFVYRPATAEGQRVPALVFFSPYYSNGGSDGGVDNQDEQAGGFNRQVIEYFVPRGYAVVLSSVRGTGYSEGCFTIGGPTESKDSVAVVEAIVAQPWSDGGVAVLGKSYVGTTANDLATEGHPAVKTIVPISAISDWYGYSFVNGVPIMPQGYSFNLYYQWGVGIQPPWASVPEGEAIHLLAEEACPETLDVQLGGATSAATGDKGPYWQVRDYNLEAAGVNVPVFVVHGLQDWNVKPDHLLPWVDLLREQGVPVKLWLGQWAHDYPNRNYFREEWTRADWNVTLLRWFDHWLKGIDTGLLAEPMADVQDDLGQWRREADWPPSRAELVTFHLDAGGVLGGEPGSGSAAWLDTGEPLPKPPRPGGAQYALYVAEPQAEDLRIAGQATLHLRLAHGAPTGTVAATLWRIAANGTAERMGFGYHDLRHRDSLEQGRPVTPGEVFDLAVRFFPQDDVVPAGWQLALTLAGNDVPVCGPTSGGPLGALLGSEPCAGDPGPFLLPVPSLGITTVEHGEGSRLELPVVRGPLDLIHPAPEPQ